MTTHDGSSDPCCVPVPDTAMATGSEYGEPGERLDERPLRPDEAALLADLTGSGDVTEAVEDSAAAERAVENDSVLPVDVGSRDDDDDDDPLTPEFRPPRDG
ncbi:MAG: hypothetical protein M3186_12750 [Actinomycetota bacterium]|nr:hypothetical protein [Actinomycetota bacterium]